MDTHSTFDIYMVLQSSEELIDDINSELFHNRND